MLGLRPARRKQFGCGTPPGWVSAKAIKIQAVVYPSRTSSGGAYCGQEAFGSVSKMMQASIEELMGVEGVGKHSANKIRDVLDAEWNTSNLGATIKKSWPAKSSPP